MGIVDSWQWLINSEYLLPIIIGFICYHIYLAICLTVICEKTGTGNIWRAWLPFVNIFILTSAGAISWIFGLLFLLGLLIPVVGPLISVGILVYIVYKVCDVRDIPTSIAWLTVFPLINVFIVPAALAWYPVIGDETVTDEIKLSPDDFANQTSSNTSSSA